MIRSILANAGLVDWSPMTVSIRTATPSDIAELLALWEVAAENDARPADTPGAVQALLARDPDACLVACGPDGRVIGSLIAGWDGWRAHLYRLAVHPGARRQGVGRALLDAGQARLAGLGATRLDAMVLEGNDLGQAVWRAAGYAPQPNWRRWVRPLGGR
jgi:ribosomal protein S18 acetylase RimI-like enzyme